jgi:hypothetical protein
MAILSEGKGVMLWLIKQGNSESFSNYLLKLFKLETGLSFYKMTYTPGDSKKFHKLISWYRLQNISQLLNDFKIYETIKKEQKEKSLNAYLQSDLHKYILENKNLNKNKFLKSLKTHSLGANKTFSELVSFYKKSMKTIHC